MPTLLDVFALPRGQRSRTRKLREAFLRGWKRRYPDGVVHEVDLARDHAALPSLDEWDVEAKFEMMYGEGKLSDEQARHWAALTKMTDQLHAADLVLISAPMWNFGVPWMLKKWIDCVAQARLTWEQRDGQYRGLLAGRPAVVLATRDGAYGHGMPMEGADFQLPYLRHVLGFMGLGPVHTVVAEGLAPAGGGIRLAMLETAMIDAESLGNSL